MRLLGILFVIASFPIFWSLLKSQGGRRFAYTALGALAFLNLPLNLDAAIIDCAGWPGHTKGLLVSLLDPLAAAICFRYASHQQRPPLLWLFAIYCGSQIPGMFVGTLFQPALFYVFQTLRVTLAFYAAYLIVRNGGLDWIARGLAIAVLTNAFFAAKDAAEGMTQAPGLLGHQNLTGLAVNLCVPLLTILGLRKNGGFFLAALGGAGVSAIIGGSRATIVFYGVAVIGTLLGSMVVRASPRKTMMAAVVFLGVLAAAPMAIEKLSARGGEFEKDGERLAFERAASMMIDEHPWGVGLNQYVNVANTGGYLSRAGVRWGQGARATNVHNFYLLARTEGGLVALAGLLAWFILPVFLAIRLAFDPKARLREVNIAVAVALAVAAIHSRYEWITVTVVPQYLIALLIGISAATMGAPKRRSRRPALSRSNLPALEEEHKRPVEGVARAPWAGPVEKQASVR